MFDAAACGLTETVNCCVTPPGVVCVWPFKTTGPVCCGCVFVFVELLGTGVTWAGLYVNPLWLVAFPLTPLTIIGFCCWTGVLLNGTTTLILNELLIVMLLFVVTLLIVTPVIWSKSLPTIVSIVPLIPVNGENVFIVGGGQVTCRENRLLKIYNYLLFAYNAIIGNKNAWVYLLIDVVIGVISFIIFHYRNGDFTKLVPFNK